MLLLSICTLLLTCDAPLLRLRLRLRELRLPFEWRVCVCVSAFLRVRSNRSTEPTRTTRRKKLNTHRQDKSTTRGQRQLAVSAAGAASVAANIRVLIRLLLQSCQLLFWWSRGANFKQAMQSVNAVLSLACLLLSFSSVFVPSKPSLSTADRNIMLSYL